MKCPVCGKYEFEEFGSWDICPVCDWEDDPLQATEHNYAGGANALSVNEARIEYFLLCSPAARKADEYRKLYRSEKSEIFERYRGINRVENDGLAEEEQKSYQQARKKYVDCLNSLLQALPKEHLD